MQCSQCQHDNRSNAKFCEACGGPLALRCPSCHNEVRPVARFCDHCGAQLDRPMPAQPETEHMVPANQPVQVGRSSLAQYTPDAERRHLTVLFCDLVDSTVFASQLDPEEWREVVRAYQEAGAKVIGRFEGHIAQYLGDGLLVYFGYPQAHEDDAQRAIRAGLGIVETLGQLNTRLERERGVRLAVRLGIHTGLVVVGNMGDDVRQEQLALGETPNLAARLQGIAAPNTLVISEATLQLLGGYFVYQSLGICQVKGFAQPIKVYQVLHESMARSRLEAAGSTSLTPLVGREEELELLLERWTQVKNGIGQVVLLSGEAGIGKSRLVQALKEHVASEPQAWLTPCQCSPYYQHSALYPMIELLQRVVLRFDREESPSQKLSKLEGFLVQYGLPLAETVPLFASLLSLPLTDDYARLSLSAEQQKQKTLQAFVTILLRIASQQPVLFVIEDLHWVDPSTLELLNLLVDQASNAPVLMLLTFRPDFISPWSDRLHLTQVPLYRLTPQQATEMTHQVTRGKLLPSEVVDQVVAKTDGVPLFVEELTKMVLESRLLREREDRYELTGPLPPLAIPATLHDSLMARLDRLATVKSMAQLGATLGREFSYALLQAVSLWDEEILHYGLQQLVKTEFLYQQGQPPQATYLFKHALIQETAYQSLLRSTRQLHHQRIAQVLEEQFPETVASEPELLAHHYTEAGLSEPAVVYWQKAGQRAVERSAHVEAMSHLTKGLEVLKTLPDNLERAQQELVMLTTLGPALIATRSYAAPEVSQVYTRARELCQQVGETPQLFSVLWGLARFYLVRAEPQTARELGEQLFSLAQRLQDPALVLEAHRALGQTLFYLGDFAGAREYLEQGIALYDPQQHRDLAFRYGRDPGVDCRGYLAWTLWVLGYPEQAIECIHKALLMAHELAHPFTLAATLIIAAMVEQFCGHVDTVQERAAAAVDLSTEHGFPYWLAAGEILQGWVLAEQGHAQAGLVQMHRGLAAWRATGAEFVRPYFVALLAEAHPQAGQVVAGLSLLAEALAVVDQHGEQWWEVELHRLMGTLALLQISERCDQHRVSPADAEEAEIHFRHALDVARQQQAKSLELRAAMSLSRLWQQQDKHQAARELLTPIYNGFCEGFETTDLKKAKALLEALSS